MVATTRSSNTNPYNLAFMLNGDDGIYANNVPISVNELLSQWNIGLSIDRGGKYYLVATSYLPGLKTLEIVKNSKDSVVLFVDRQLNF
jgi:hypothetical protein